MTVYIINPDKNSLTSRTGSEHKHNRQKPLLKWKVRVVEDGANRNAKTTLAVITPIAHFGWSRRVVFSLAIWALRHAIP